MIPLARGQRTAFVLFWLDQRRSNHNFEVFLMTNGYNRRCSKCGHTCWAIGDGFVAPWYIEPAYQRSRAADLLTARGRRLFERTERL